jgi:hypothetical protein
VSDEQDSAPRTPRRPYFRPASNVPKLSPESAARESQVVRAATERFGLAGAMAFLNADVGLEARPLKLAAASPEGARAVLALIAARDDADPGE